LLDGRAVDGDLLADLLSLLFTRVIAYEVSFEGVNVFGHGFHFRGLALVSFHEIFYGVEVLEVADSLSHDGLFLGLNCVQVFEGLGHGSDGRVLVSTCFIGLRKHTGQFSSSFS